MPRSLPADFAFSPALPARAVAAFRRVDLDEQFDGTAMDAALAAVDYPLGPIPPRADLLTPAQRAAVELITELDLSTNNNDIDQQMPRDRGARRRWLGLDPPGPLEQRVTFSLGEQTLTEPVWRAVKLLEDAEEDLEPLLAGFSTAERLALWGAVNATWPEDWGLDEWLFFNYNEDDSLLERIGDDGRDWAPAYLDALLASERSDRTPLLPFLALVRAGIPVEPRWDALLPTGSREHTVECVMALPVERRGAAIVASMAKDHPGYAVSNGLTLLPLVPDPAIARAVLARIDKSVSSPRQIKDRLREAGKGHPDVLAVLTAFERGKPAPVVLTAARQRSPRALTELSDSDRAQILAAGRLYHGRKVPLEELLSSDPDSEESLLHLLDYRAVLDATGTHLYDAWQYNADSGSIFKAGTTKLVADIIQGSVECSDKTLLEALEEVVRVRAPKPKKAGASKSGKKGAVGKRVTKKVAVKKAASKKAASKKATSKKVAVKKAASQKAASKPAAKKAAAKKAAAKKAAAKKPSAKKTAAKKTAAKKTAAKKTAAKKVTAGTAAVRASTAKESAAKKSR